MLGVPPDPAAVVVDLLQADRPPQALEGLGPRDHQPGRLLAVRAAQTGALVATYSRARPDSPRSSPRPGDRRSSGQPGAGSGHGSRLRSERSERGPGSISPDPWPILFAPGPDHFPISLCGANGRDLGAPTRSPEPSGQVIGLGCDSELAPDQITNPSQGPAIGLESGLEGVLAEDRRSAVPLRGGQLGRSPRPGAAVKGLQPGGRMVAQVLGPSPNGPEADAQSLGDRGMSQATGSEQSSALQPTFFHLVLSQFAKAPHERNDVKNPSGRGSDLPEAQ